MRFSIFLLLVFVVSACSSSKKNEEITDAESVVADYKKYFSPTAFDGKTRYFVFDEEANVEGQDEMVTKALRRIEKRTESTILAVEYRCFSDTCFSVDSTILELRDDGIYILESYVNVGGEWTPLEYMEESVVIPWSWKKDREVSYSRRYKPEGSPMMTMKIKRKFTGFKEMKIEGIGNVMVAIREEKQLRSSDKLNVTSNVIMWDVPGLGLYRYESKREGYSYVMKFRDEISESEYNTFLGR